MADRDEQDPRSIIDRWFDAINAADFTAAVALLSDDFVSEYPQSGEIIRGPRDMLAVFRNYPGSLREGNVQRDTQKVIGGDQWAMTPSFVLVRVTGNGGARTAIVKSRYPDGSMWWILNFFEFEAGKIKKTTAYFAPEFEPPAWRAPWAEVRTPTPAA